MMLQHDFHTIVQTFDQLTAGEKLARIERLARSLQELTAERQVSATQQRQALQDLRRTMATLPVHHPDEGFSNRDHDRLLYGDP